MSHWDFGPPSADEYDPPRPPGPGRAGDPAGSQHSAEPPADDRWAADDRWLADEQWPANARWSPGHGGPAAGERPADEDWDVDDPGPYPIIYERDPFLAPPLPPRVPEPAPPADNLGLAAAYPGLPGDAGPAAAPGPATPRTVDPGIFDPGAANLGTYNPGPGGPGGGNPGAAEWAEWAEWETARSRRRPGARRWVLPAGIAVVAAALAAAAILLTSSHSSAPGGGAAPAGPGTAVSPGRQSAAGTPGGTASAALPATPSGAATPSAPATPSGPASVTAPEDGPLTMAQARQVLAGYTTANNDANASRDNALLATVETGSSYAIDTGLYQAQRATGATPFPAFGPAAATYYLPRGEPASGPRWFVAQVANAFRSSPGKVSSTEYVLFTQAVPGGPWLDAAEPYLLPGAGVPQVTVGSDGLATAVSPQDGSAAVAPGQLPAVTAAALDGAAPAAVAVPGNLGDSAARQLARKEVPGGKVTDAHAPASGGDGPEFALRTADGGALVFYSDAAELTITPPAGSLLHLTVPGLYSAGQALSRAGLSYLEQFAAYDPPAGGTPRIVADYSGITGKN